MASTMENPVIDSSFPSTSTSPSQSQQEATKSAFWEKLKQLWDTIRMTVFVLGSAMVLFVAARNTITWYAQQLWGASGSYWQSQWENIHAFFGNDDVAMGFFGTFFVVQVSFFGFNVFLMILDLTGRPQVLLQYKIQDAKEVPLDGAKFMRCLRVVLFNQLVLGVPVTYLIAHVFIWRGCDFGPELPTFHWVLLELTVFTLVEEFTFYYSHRMLHLPQFYKYIHKQHHEWTASIGIVGVYAHPVEHILSNIIPPVCGPFIMQSHIATAWLWFALAMVSTSISHSGYHFPFFPSPEAHDFHHLKFTNNFGMLGILDRLHGTDLMFRSTKQYQRHFMLLCLTPARQMVPDDPKNGKKAE